MRINALEDLPIHLQKLNTGLRKIQAKPNSQIANRALGRLPAGVMNQTEARYAAYLETKKQAGEILAYYFEIGRAHV